MRANAPASFKRPGRASALRLLTALFGAPAAWIAQLSLSEPLAAHACYPYQMPLPEPLWQELPATLAMISGVCLAIALLSGFMAWTLCQRTRAPLQDERDDRTRFLAKLSAMSSFIFTMAVLFTACAVLLVSPCSPWH
ncbi:hypothetical protein [Methylobacter sp. YRD-M1]|uniref:hypothetical protein n=1 Tax=Methylobacter sp. YRD-M1 TaxID=2911520 RepID=UPI00227A7290|nr:hypothetical protein [Methylobacter sp. YRD-M1]WAK02633.1 hypothetical protein LZ558_02250 [Methylobacter sp. YRD-M1]